MSEKIDVTVDCRFNKKIRIVQREASVQIMASSTLIMATEFDTAALIAVLWETLSDRTRDRMLEGRMGADVRRLVEQNRIVTSVFGKDEKNG